MFLLEVSEALVMPHVQRRNAEPAIANKQSIALAMKLFGATTLSAAQDLCTHEPRQKRGRCHLCPRNSDVKSANRCVTCGRFVCGSHHTKLISYKCNICRGDDD